MRYIMVFLAVLTLSVVCYSQSSPNMSDPNTVLAEGNTMGTTISIISTTVVAIATVALAILTGWYASLTKAMVAETKEAREPDVHLDFELPENMLRLVIGNSGRSSAKNVKFKITSDINCVRHFYQNGNAGLASLPIFKSGISYLAPGRKLIFDAGHLDLAKEKPVSELFKVLVQYENVNGKAYKRDIMIDMGQYRTVLLFESFKDSNLAIAEAIREAKGHSQNQNIS